ncbi:MAG: hypothetical protein ABIR46_01310 [Candidatus Saccharimonadales bacterium]
MRSLFSKRLLSLVSLLAVVFAVAPAIPATATTPTSTLTFENTCAGLVATLVNTTDSPRDYSVVVMHDGLGAEGSIAKDVQPGQTWVSPPSGRRFTVTMRVDERSLFTSQVNLGNASWTAPAECPMAGGTTVIQWGPKLTKNKKRPVVTIKTVASSTRVGYKLDGAVYPTFGDSRSPGVYQIKLNYHRPGQKWCYTVYAYYSDGIVPVYGEHAVAGRKCFRRPRR